MKRLILTAPLFAVAIAMLNVSSFKVLWLYVSWFNQVLATFTFFTIAHFLRHHITVTDLTRTDVPPTIVDGSMHQHLGLVTGCQEQGSSQEDSI